MSSKVTTICLWYTHFSHDDISFRRQRSFYKVMIWKTKFLQQVHDIKYSGVSRVGIRGVSKSPKFKGLVKGGASNSVFRVDLKKSCPGGGGGFRATRKPPWIRHWKYTALSIRSWYERHCDFHEVIHFCYLMQSRHTEKMFIMCHNVFPPVTIYAVMMQHFLE